jgi:hypothetical protein
MRLCIYGVVILFERQMGRTALACHAGAPWSHSGDMFAWLVLKAPASVNSNEKAITVDLFAHDVFGRRCVLFRFLKAARQMHSLFVISFFLSVTGSMCRSLLPAQCICIFSMFPIRMFGVCCLCACVFVIARWVLKGEDGRAIHHAAGCNNHEALDVLLKAAGSKGVDVDAKDSFGLSPLHAAGV